MQLVKWLVNSAIKLLIRICCRVHDVPLAQVPHRGPLIVILNHITFLEAPLLYTYLLPRKLTGFAKVEFWDKPLSRFLFTMWEGIPLHRGEADVNALRLALDFLSKAYIVGVAPEGTRSRDGKMRQAHPGVVPMALRSNAPILPIAHYGGEKLNNNLRRLRRTDFYIQVGRPFYLETTGAKITRPVRQQMVDEMMYQIAALLPPEYRGYYSNLEQATAQYLRFTDEG